MITENTDLKIELLPEHIIDQIKAGEVLERPASLIKELIENSIDAKADEINLHLVDNGMELISLEDNGVGMNFKNLPMAFLRHATSKIKKFEDIYRLHSYGFRGEALASIAAMARVTCQSQPKNLNSEGGKIIINGGVEELLVPMKNPKSGTAFYIKNLFYNTPARLKFVKSKTSERIQLKKMITSFLISHPEIKFSIKWDDKEKDVYEKHPADDYLSRFKEIVFPKRKEESPILHAQSSYDGHKVEVFFTLEPLKNSPNKHQLLFANERIFYDKNLHQAILRATDSLWKFGESGHYVVFITTPPEEIDVNVHPNKTQIKFSKSDVVYSLLVNSFKEAIRRYQLDYRKNEIQSMEMPSFDSQSFIPVEEDRSHSLENLRDMTFKSKPLPSVSLSNITEEDKSEFINLNSNYFIFKDQEFYYLTSKIKLIQHYLYNLYLNAEAKEDNISPLLISEPFQIDESIDVYFSILKRFGFEYDRLNSKTIVLRTIPRKTHRDLIKISAQVLQKYFLTTKAKILDAKKLHSIVLEYSPLLTNISPQLIFNLYENNKENVKELAIKLDDLTLGKMSNDL